MGWAICSSAAYSLKTLDDTPKSKWVVARSEKAAPSIAFMVDKLSELITLTENEMTKAETGEESFIYAHAAHKANVLQLIDLVMLLATLENQRRQSER